MMSAQSTKWTVLVLAVMAALANTASANFIMRSYKVSEVAAIHEFDAQSSYFRHFPTINVLKSLTDDQFEEQARHMRTYMRSMFLSLSSHPNPARSQERSYINVAPRLAVKPIDDVVAYENHRLSMVRELFSGKNIRTDQIFHADGQQVIYPIDNVTYGIVLPNYGAERVTLIDSSNINYLEDSAIFTLVNNILLLKEHKIKFYRIFNCATTRGQLLARDGCLTALPDNEHAVYTMEIMQLFSAYFRLNLSKFDTKLTTYMDTLNEITSEPTNFPWSKQPSEVKMALLAKDVQYVMAKRYKLTSNELLNYNDKFIYAMLRTIRDTYFMNDFEDEYPVFPDQASETTLSSTGTVVYTPEKRRGSHESVSSGNSKKTVKSHSIKSLFDRNSFKKFFPSRSRANSKSSGNSVDYAIPNIPAKNQDAYYTHAIGV